MCVRDESDNNTEERTYCSIHITNDLSRSFVISNHGSQQ